MTNYDTGEVEGTGIEPRTRRAATESMAVDAYGHGEGSGMFDVYSASGNTYTVSLLDPLGCTCPDFTQRGDQLGDAGCKHIRRVRMMLGIDPVPEALLEQRDGTLKANMEKFGAEPDPEPVTVEEQAAQAVRAMADGGVVLEESDEDSAADGCPHDRDGCEGADADVERPVLCWSCWSDWAEN